MLEKGYHQGIGKRRSSYPGPVDTDCRGNLHYGRGDTPKEAQHEEKRTKWMLYKPEQQQKIQNNRKGKCTNKTKVTKKAPDSEDESNLAKTFHLLV